MRKRWNNLLYIEQVHSERRFYREFVRKGDLVFDIGANTGLKTEAFLALGARTVAIEPNPTCAEKIRGRNHRAISASRLQIEEIAIASKRTRITLRVFAEDISITSGSQAFVEAATASGISSTSAMVVEAVTADDLVDRFGKPVFIKVDVEGMDAEVLAGLHHRPRFVSFEFNTKATLWDQARRCIREVLRLGFTEANFTGPGMPKLLLKSWVPLQVVVDEVRRWAGSRETFGDIIVR